MTHPQQTTREVIEQLVDALDHCMSAITERGLNGSPDQAEKWGLQLPLVRAESAIAAGQQALEQTQVEAEPEWNDENVIAYCIARGISAAKAFTTGATQPQATEPAPSTAGEAVHKYNLELPDGDKRDARVCFSARTINNGVLTHDLCITVRDSATTPQVEPAPSPEDYWTNDTSKTLDKNK